MNRRVDIREDTKRYQETLSYASNKVDYVGENIYMLPSKYEPEHESLEQLDIIIKS